MPRRDDLHRILVIGSGPIVIGQGAEFDYSGTQAAKALKEEGYEVVLANSNRATIMTDPEFADGTYKVNAARVTGARGAPRSHGMAPRKPRGHVVSSTGSPMKPQAAFLPNIQTS